MATDFFPARGCIYRINLGGGSGGSQGGGAFALNPSLSASGNDSYAILLTGPQGNDVDLVQPVVTLDRGKFLYEFGQQFGEMQIGGMILLGPVGQKSVGMDKLLQYVAKNRVSNSKGTISLSMPGQLAYKLFLVGCGFGSYDAEYNVLSFGLTTLIAEPPGGGGR